MARKKSRTHAKAGKILSLAGSDLVQRRVQTAFAAAHEEKAGALAQVKAAVQHHQTIINAFNKVSATLSDLA